MEIRFDMHIDAPQSVVWSFLDDDEKLPLWMTEIVETSFPEGRDRENPVGTRFRQKIREGGRVRDYDGEVTVYRPEQLLGIRMGDQKFSVDVLYRLARAQPDGPAQSASEGTRLDYRATVTTYSTFAKIMGFLFRPLTRNILRRHMRNLKRISEVAA